MSGRAVELASFLVALSIGALARAEAPAFVWEAPEGCPSSTDMEGRIRARVTSGSVWRVRGRVLREAAGFQVQLTTPGGERVLTAPTCDQAAEAAIVIVALAVDGATLRPSAGEVRPPTGPSAADAETVARDEAPPRAPAQARMPERHWGVSLGGALDASTLPEPSPGLTGAVAFSAGALSLGVEVSGFRAQSQRASGEPPVAVTMALVDVMATGCVTGRPLARALEAGGCVGAGVGILPAESDGITSPKASVGIRPQALVALRAGWILSDHLVLRIQAGPLLDPVRPSFRVDGLGEIYRPPAFTFRGSAGLEVRFR